MNQPAIQLRATTVDDNEFLCRLYTSVRAEEVAFWGWSADRCNAFLRMQFGMQQRAYAMQFAGMDQLIYLEREPVGRFLVERNADRFHLVDIALLSEHRNKGIGKYLIEKLQSEASAKGLPVILSVLKNNPAIRLYQRLGFTITGEEGLHFLMEWRP